MTLKEAWGILEKDLDGIMQFLSSLPDAKSQSEAIDRIYKKAKRIAKCLMAKNHPDVNRHDPLAPERFREIKQAIDTIEVHTEDFQKRVDKLMIRKPSKNDVVIIIGK